MTDTKFCTPKKPYQKLMDKIKIPPSPYMKKIGFGTGIAVYELERSPAFNKFRSPWAIKKLINRKGDNSLIKSRLKNEAEILRKLVHPHIVGFRAYLEGSEESNQILIMEECSSCLGDLIEDRGDNEFGPFPSEIIGKVLLDVAQALSYLHNTALLLHGDLKSYNVLVKGDFEICKLCDFGVCIPLNKQGKVDQEKAPGAEYVGSRPWSAPEVLGYPQEITTKADIYSFGLIIWEMITLTLPLTEDLADDISKCTDMDPDKLDELLEKMGSHKRPPIPTDIDLGTEYEPILEIYYCSTHENMECRPSAIDLTMILQELQ